MRKLILVISGFTEELHEDTGSFELYTKLWPYANMGAHGEEVLIAFKPWNHDWKSFAKQMNAWNVSECFVCSYSWGCGHGLMKFAKHFSGPIQAVLCDPVYYSRFWVTKWLAVLADMTIKYPKNVTIKKWFYQTLDEPGGDKVANAPKGIKLNAPHTQIDSHPAYHEAAEQLVKEFVNA